jgi:hypothetical protein
MMHFNLLHYFSSPAVVFVLLPCMAFNATGDLLLTLSCDMSTHVRGSLDINDRPMGRVARTGRDVFSSEPFLVPGSAVSASGRDEAERMLQLPMQVMRSGSRFIEVATEQKMCHWSRSFHIT